MYDVLNTKEICRGINGFPVRGECRKSDYSNYKAGAMWLTACPLCRFQYCEIYIALDTLAKKEQIFKRKMIFWDIHNQAVKPMDRFTFWFLDESVFTEKILKYTLIPYVH
jgi:hypothetical protein